MANKRTCYRCHGTISVLDYSESQKQNRDVFCDCRMCNGKGYIYEDKEGSQIYKRYEETETEFLNRIKDL